MRGKRWSVGTLKQGRAAKRKGAEAQRGRDAGERETHMCRLFHLTILLKRIMRSLQAAFPQYLSNNDFYHR